MQGFFEPRQIKFRPSVECFAGLNPVITGIQVEHQTHAVPDFPSDGLDPLALVAGPLAAQVKLDAAETALDQFSRSSCDRFRVLRPINIARVGRKTVVDARS